MSAYREGFGPLEHKRAEVALVRARVAASAGTLARLAGARIGRVAGAVSGLAGLLILAAVFGLSPSNVREGFLALAYFGVGLAALVVQLVSGAAAKSVLVRRARAFRETGTESARDLLQASDLQTAEGLDPWPAVTKRLRKLEKAALVWPLVLASFFLPLAVHGAVYAPFAAFGGVAHPLDDFSVWVMLSTVIVGHAHLALALCAAHFGSQLADAETPAITDASTRKAWSRAFWVAVGVASAPGIILLAVPTVLSLATGIAVIPLMFRVAHQLALRERAVTDAVAADVARIRAGVDVEQMERVRQQLVATAEGVRLSAPEPRTRVAEAPQPAPVAAPESLEDDGRLVHDEDYAAPLTSSPRPRRESA